MSLTNQVSNVYSSWGRTRQPKSLAGKHGVNINALETPATNGNFIGNAAPTGAGSNLKGLATQNQRYLHIRFKETNGTARKIKVYGLIHAFGDDTWFELNSTAGTAVETATVTSGTDFKIFEIAGVDRVYFTYTGTGTLDTDDVVQAAGSTFQGS